MELYTYPYDKDDYLQKLKFLKMLPYYIKDVMNRHSFADTIERAFRNKDRFGEPGKKEKDASLYSREKSGMK